MREPDLWWQLRTGEWILEHHQIPQTDIFSYTFAGHEWINVKWGSEVLFALIEKISGPECVFLLQGIVSCIIVFVLLQFGFIIRNPQSPPDSAIQAGATRNFSMVVASLLTLIVIEYRIIGRPEMFSHLFTVVFLFFLLKHRTDSSNKIFLLVPLQILWANLHEAFGIGIVLIGIFCAGEWAEYFLSKRNILQKKNAPKKISGLLLAAIASIVVNPNGIKLFTRPLQILGQVYENKYTTELFDFRSPEYWKWNVYLAIGILVIGALGSFTLYRLLKTKAGRLRLFMEQFGIGYLITLAAFSYLALTAYRNVAFFSLVFFPFFVFGLNALFMKIPFIKKQKLVASVVLCMVAGVLYLSIVSGKYYQLTKSRDHFGMEILSTYNPAEAAAFVWQNKIEGKCFSDYLTSSYLLWKLKPEFKTYIDLRDLDVFPQEFFSSFAEAVTYPGEFQKLDSLHQFSYVVLYRPQFASLHRYLYNESGFQLVHLSAVAAVYMRKDSAQKNFNEKIPAPSSYPLLSKINFLLNPFFRYGETDGSANYDYIYASFYNTVGDFEKAKFYADASLNSRSHEKYKSLQMLGEIKYSLALRSDSVNEKTVFLNEAGNYYQQSLNEKNDFAPAYLGLGAVYFQEQNYQMALEQFRRAIAFDYENLNAHLFAAECCKYFVNQNYNAEGFTDEAIEHLKNADHLNPDNPNILLNLGFLYFKKNDCKNSSAYLNRIKNFEGLRAEEKTRVEDCLRKCGY